jgi:hypothetical protein
MATLPEGTRSRVKDIALAVMVGICIGGLLPPMVRPAELVLWGVGICIGGLLALALF